MYKSGFLFSFLWSQIYWSFLLDFLWKSFYTYGAHTCNVCHYTSFLNYPFFPLEFILYMIEKDLLNWSFSKNAMQLSFNLRNLLTNLPRPRVVYSMCYCLNDN